MAVDKLVDSTQLDSDLTSVANAIRTKGGTSAQLAFPADFVSAINSISGGDTPVAPTGYTRLLYLQASGTQYIDTGKYAKLSSSAKIDISPDSGSQGSYANPFGSSNPPFSAFVCNNYVAYPATTGANGVYWNFGDLTDQKQSSAIPAWSRTTVTLSKDGGAFKTYGYEQDMPVTFAASSLTENQASHIGLFCRINNGTAERFFKGKIYEYWYYENDTLLQHMIPVKRDSDDVLGMYDLENDVFYTNAGIGSFVGGAWE